jgi:hypothetical protein
MDKPKYNIGDIVFLPRLTVDDISDLDRIIDQLEILRVRIVGINIATYTGYPVERIVYHVKIVRTNHIIQRYIDEASLKVSNQDAIDYVGELFLKKIEELKRISE